MANFFSNAPEPATELGRYRVLAPSAAIRVSPLALGAMSIGDAWSSAMGSMNKEQSFKLLDAFVAAGGNFIDTANGYQNEQSETWLGEWVTERGIRDQLVLATKYTSDYRSHAEGKGKVPNCTGNHRKSLHISVRDSLKKLQTDYIDLLYVHWWDFTTSIKEVMDSLHFLVQQGKVLYLGASDMPAWVVSAANTYAIDNSKTPFSVYQGRWSVMQRDFERDIIPMARMFGMALVPWNVVGGGKFQTKKAIEERKKNGEGLRAFATTSEQSESEEKISAALEKVAGEVGVESITAVALAYVLHKAANVVPLVGGRKVEHLEDNIKALSIRLSEEQITYLESVVEFDVGFPHDFLGTDPNVTGRSMRLDRNALLKFPMAQKPSSV
ncbi:aryl-alcohol dehydrogenase [Pochonia chlamydosporia 170]|uniref:Aldo-keto reductase ausK n=1 Tax=Pochonia chlamydosporia 170 TaxID=1380566 RepID=A0A179G3Q5_METCM|nr:aryl-alcohol dehydrogenase [Pochonia chlamydosporia 170]OAQ72504.1 aryl-alcohol dehydrogenase [Pochonia chlamydosporia 170]